MASLGLLKVAKHGRGEYIYLIRFHYARPPSEWVSVTVSIRDTLERILQRELDEAWITDRRIDLRQRTWVFDVRGWRIGERRMVGHVEKLGAEQNALGFCDAKGLTDRQVHVRLMWPNKAIARNVAKTRRAIRPDYWRLHEGVGVHEVI